MILVFGKTGQVGTELQLLDGVVTLGRNQADLSNPMTCADAIFEHAPLAVINAAAYNFVDKAEEEMGLAFAINGDAPTAMAQACSYLKIPFVHISTDYVFDGTGDTSWHTTDETVPENAYGRSKLAGEIGIRASGGTYAILRTSWVFSTSGTNFVKTMLRLSETRKALNIVADQIGGPTPARDIAVACLKIANQLRKDPSKSGSYHYSGYPDVSWAEFANEIFKQARRAVVVTPISTVDYPTRAIRPMNSRIDCGTTEQMFDVIRPDWREGLKTILKELEVI